MGWSSGKIWYPDNSRTPAPTSSEIFLQSLFQSPSTVTRSRPPGELTVDVPVDRLRGVDEKLTGRLKRLDVYTVRDLLYLFPRRHLDYSNVVKISDLVPGEMCTVGRDSIGSAEPERRTRWEAHRHRGSYKRRYRQHPGMVARGKVH